VRRVTCVWVCSVALAWGVTYAIAHCIRRGRQRQWSREFLGRWINSVQCGCTEDVLGVPVYRTIGFCRQQWIIDPFGQTRCKCERLDDAIDAVQSSEKILRRARERSVP
jgi:hypothetical protein